MPKKRVRKKRNVHRASKRTSRRAPRRHVSRKARTSSPIVGTRIGLVLKNLIVFLALALISYLLSFVLVNEIFIRLLTFLALVFVFLGVAFLIVLLVMLILRSMKNKRR